MSNVGDRSSSEVTTSWHDKNVPITTTTTTTTTVAVVAAAAK